MNQRANQTANTPFQTYGGQFVAPVNAEQTSGIIGTNAAANEAQPFYSAATGTLGSAQASTTPVNAAAELGTAASGAPLTGSTIERYLSPYLGTVLGSTAALENQQNQQAQAGQLGDAIRSGAFGSDRTGIAGANLQQQLDLANANILSGIANTGYQSALGTAQGQQQIGLGAAAQLANIGQTAYGEGSNTAAQLASLGTGAQTAGLQGAQAQIAAGTVQQQTQQAQDTALYNQFLQQQSYPFQVDQFLANIAEGTGALSGSTTTTTTPGALLGAARGGAANAERFYTGGVVPFRRRRDVGGGLAPVLDEQRQMYAPSGGQLQIPTAGGAQRQLAVAPAPTPGPSTLGQLSSLAGLVRSGQSLYDGFRSPAPTSAPVSSPNYGLVPAGSTGLSYFVPGLGRRTGGRVRYAWGGAPYGAGLEIPDVSSAAPPLRAAAAPAMPSSTAQDIGDAAKIAGLVMGLAAGGRARGRPRFDAGGDTYDLEPPGPQPSGATTFALPGAPAPAPPGAPLPPIPMPAPGSLAAPAVAADPAGATPGSSGSLWGRLEGDIRSPAGLAILEGLGAAATAPTVHRLAAIAAGLGTAAGAYPRLQQGLAEAALTRAKVPEQQAEAGLRQFALQQANGSETPTPYALPSNPVRPQWMGTGAGNPNDPREVAFERYAPLPTGIPASVTQRQIQLSWANPEAAKLTGVQYEQNLTQVNNTRTRDANGAYLQYAAAAQAAPGGALTALRAINPADAARALAFANLGPNATPAQQDAAARSWAARMALQTHSWSSRPSEVRNGALIDATTNTPVAGAAQLFTGMTPEARAAALEYWTKPQVFGAGLPVAPYIHYGFRSPEQAIIAQNRLATGTAVPLGGEPPAPAASTAPPTAPLPTPPTRPAAAAAPAPGPKAPLAPAPPQAPVVPASVGGAYTDHAFAEAASDPAYRVDNGPPATDQASLAAREARMQANQKNSVALGAVAGEITNEQANVKMYLTSALDILNSKGAAPWTGFPGEVRAEISSKFNGVDAGNYEAVAKYLMNAAVQQGHTNFPNATQSEFAQQVGSMSPSAKMPPQTIAELAHMGLRTANWMIRSAERAQVWAKDPQLDPNAFTNWNQQYFPRDKLVNADKVYTNAKTGQRLYLIGGKLVQ